MTDDVLFTRFAALADPTDDSDWLDVRRRARRARMRVAVVATASAAAILVAAAVAASNGWMFTTRDRQVTATTSVSLHGKTWRVSITSGTFGRRCFRIAGPTPTRKICDGGLKALVRARQFGAVGLTVPGGQIWVGASIGFARRIVITNADGRAASTVTMTAPKGTKTPFRYWALAVSGTATSITASDGHGHSIRRPLGRASVAHLTRHAPPFRVRPA